jgi:hypothetical protein
VCNLYSITTNQAAIIALFRVVNRYIGNLAPMPGVSGLQGAYRPHRRRGARTRHRAVGHAVVRADAHGGDQRSAKCHKKRGWFCSVQG